jgi:hypothetical protein
MRPPRQLGREAGKERLQKVTDIAGTDAVREVLPDVLEADRIAHHPKAAARPAWNRVIGRAHGR